MDLRVVIIAAIISIIHVCNGKWQGCPTTETRCGANQVTSVPSSVRRILGRYAYHYTKYTHAYGIPILGSGAVSNAAFARACYMHKVLLADNPKIRDWMCYNNARYGIIGVREGVTHIPEHRSLGSWWNQRARGLGGTKHLPVSTGGEENLLCWSNDRYKTEDIGLHEFVHGIVNLGAADALRIVPRIKSQMSRARYAGLWRSTYAMQSWEEYFAEGAQSFFNVNEYQPRANGIHNHVNTRTKLRSYDPGLYALVKEVFPCQNYIKDRCDKTNRVVALKMNCAGGGGTTVTKGGGGTGTGGGGKTKTPQPPQPGNCVDKNSSCASWASRGECTKNPGYMKPNCCKSCSASPNCKDGNSSCASWASRGECNRNPAYMHQNCKRSCNKC